MKRRKARHYTTTFKEKTVELSYVRGNVKQISLQYSQSIGQFKGIT